MAAPAYIPDSLQRRGVTEVFLREGISKKLNIGIPAVEVTVCLFPDTFHEPKGYVSDVIPLDIEAMINGNLQIFHMVLKAIPEDAHKAQFSKSLNAFEKEIIVYQDLIPVWKDHLNLAMLRPLKIAKCFNIDKSNSLILLENLSAEEFHVTSMKSENMKADEVDLILGELARLHAITFDFIERYPKEKFLSDFDGTFCFDGLQSPDGSERACFQAKMMKEFWLTAVRIYNNAHPELDDKTAKLLDCFARQIYKKIKATCNSNRDGFNVLAHNDFHKKNIMIKKEKDKPVDLRIVDFQLMKMSRPPLDLHMFYSFCFKPCFRRQHELIWNRYYYGKLAKRLNELGHNPEILYSLDQFEEDFADFSLMTLHYSMDHALQSFFAKLTLPKEDFPPAKTLEQELDQWKRMCQMAIDNPTEKLVGTISDLIDDAIARELMK